MKQLYSSLIFIFLFLLSDAADAQIKYATRVTAWSSQNRATGSWSASNAAGAPNVVGCGDNGSAWASGAADNRREFLELEYSDPAPISRVFIHETYYPGAVDTVYVMNPSSGLWEKVYEGTAAAFPTCPRVFSVAFPLTAFPVSKLRIALNSPAVTGYNEIDAVGVAAYTDGGAIAGNQDACSSAPPALFTNLESAFSGNAAAVYQWQDSTESGSWQDIAGAMTATYQSPALTQTTWFRRKATLAGVTEYSTIIKVNYLPSGDPAVIPTSGWNFYVYQSKVINLSTSVYKGFYSRTGLNFNTRSDWNAGVTPITATGYLGCTVANNDFVLAARRKGLPAGNYVLQVLESRGTLRVYVNGVEQSGSSGAISLGPLTPDSEVEVRLMDVSGDAYMSIEMRAGAINGGDIGEPQNICLNETPAAFVNNIAAYGGAAPATIVYQWQDSLAGASWINIPGATSATYQAGALSQTKWFRRKASDNTNATAYSDEVKVNVATIQGDTSVFGNNAWNIYAFNGNDINLVTNSYRGFYTATGLNIVTSDHWNYFESPSSATGYVGCPVNFDNFLFSLRRQGFPAGNYRLNITVVEDQVMVIVNGVVMHTGGTTSLALSGLDGNSKVELRVRETTSTSRITFEFLRIDYSIADFVATGCRTFTANNVKGTEWYDITDGTGKLLASIHPNGNDLGTVTLNTRHYGLGAANIPTNTVNRKKYLPRYFNFNSSKYPSANFPVPVKVRLYYKNSEFEDYKTAIEKPATTRGELGVAHYSGSWEDCEMSNNTAGGELLGSPANADFTADGFYLEGSTSSFSEFGSLEGSPTLPVKLTRFRAEMQNNVVKLSWATVQELDNKGFEILRSTDGKNFVKIGWVDGHGTTNDVKQYAFTDVAPAAGKNFYRLRQVDIDNNSAFSDIAAVSTGRMLKLTLSPNPVENVLYIEHDAKNISSLRILDMQGRPVWRNEGQNPSSLITVPVQQLTKGMYLLEALDKQGIRHTEKFLKK
ncbi:MAG: T9SS type A sorting domain-containing protein [Pseudobacter sp.]|uniref:T9SS type A sorting domain-containing protein n=1 Tax=Pseudobacter sp. TaxID=2045420 RepID=UPI003F7D8E49